MTMSLVSNSLRHDRACPVGLQHTDLIRAGEFRRLVGTARFSRARVKIRYHSLPTKSAAQIVGIDLTSG